MLSQRGKKETRGFQIAKMKKRFSMIQVGSRWKGCRCASDHRIASFHQNPFLLILRHTLSRIENTLPGRESFDIEIYGMEGIPPADLAAWKKRNAEETGQSQQENRPKKPKYSTAPLTAAEIQSQLAAHKALMSGQPLPGTLAPGGYGVPPPGFGMPPGFMAPPPFMMGYGIFLFLGSRIISHSRTLLFRNLRMPPPPPGFIPPVSGMPFPPPPFAGFPPGWLYFPFWRCRYPFLVTHVTHVCFHRMPPPPGFMPPPPGSGMPLPFPPPPFSGLPSGLVSFQFALILSPPRRPNC